MKKLLLFIFIAASFTVYSQTSDPALNKRLSQYLAYSKDLKIDQLLGYMYPRIFEMASKNQIKEALVSAYNNPDIQIKLDSIAISKVLPISKFNKGAYTKFSYAVKMQIKLLKEEMAESANKILENFKEKFGEENVTYDETAKLFLVYQTKEALAIKDNYSKNIWTILGLEKDQNINSIIPAVIKKKYSL
jgi:hypothetical protein